MPSPSQVFCEPPRHHGALGGAGIYPPPTLIATESDHDWAEYWGGANQRRERAKHINIKKAKEGSWGSKVRK